APEREQVPERAPPAEPTEAEELAGRAAHTEHTEQERRRIHTALLAGLLSHIGLRDPERREYAGARGARFAVFPGSALFKQQPRWGVAAELVEASRPGGGI